MALAASGKGVHHITTHPLSVHLKVKVRYEPGGGDAPERGGYYEYSYQRNARSYWIARSTKVALLSRGKYLLTDKETLSLNCYVNGFRISHKVHFTLCDGASLDLAAVSVI
jgi:hypothetical protein